jgi:hypothetical protein
MILTSLDPMPWNVKKGANMKKKVFAGIATGLLIIGTALVALATPAQWATNGHYYEVLTPPSGVNWDQAKIAAETIIFQGLQGHLATVMNGEENSFIYGLLPSAASTWGYCQ